MHPCPARWPRRLARSAVVVLAAALVAGACSSSTGTATDPATTPPPTATPSATAALVDAVCAGTATTASAGTVTTPELTEASGIVASPHHPGVWWTHNDSGDTARFFAVDEDGSLAAVISVAGAQATDWEDIAVGPAVRTATGGESGTAVYLGDIGDNDAKRAEIVVHRVAEPDPGAGSQVVHDDQPLRLRYPDGAHDAEALIVDRDSGELVIVTKDWSLTGHSQVYRTDGTAPAGGGPVTLEHVATLDLGLGALVTGGDISPDGTVVALRTYGGVILYRRPEGQPLWRALATTGCTVSIPGEKQGEAVGFSPDGASMLTISEGAQPVLHRTSA